MTGPWLYLRIDQVIDARVVHPAGLTKRYKLDISQTQVGDTGLIGTGGSLAAPPHTLNLRKSA